MQRLFALSQWAFLAAGAGNHYPGQLARTVRLEVNAPVETGLYIVPYDEQTGEQKEPVFLALVKGRDLVEFSADYAFDLVPQDDLYILTVDGQLTHVEVEDAVSFTKIVERKRRDPVLEQMMWEANRNMEARLAQQSEHLTRMFAAEAAAIRNEAKASAVSAPTVTDPATTPPASPPSAPASEANGDGGGAQNGA